MDPKRKQERYNRLYDQIAGLLTATSDPDARMATIIAVLHHKMEYFFWTGFYFLRNGELTVKCYQGPVACQVLKKNQGVCWAGINQAKPIIVPDVHLFPGHIACDSRSNSEIVVPVTGPEGAINGVLDVDSEQKSAFDEVDAVNLERIVKLIFSA